MGPYSIAVDWITDKIYLAQKSISRIDVFTSNGLNRTNIVTSNIFTPNCIALDPTNSFLFLVDSGNPVNKLQPPKIERMLMDGNGRQIIIKEKILEPTAITLDSIKKRIYWIDKKYDHLETCDYYGSKRHIIASGSQNLPHSLSLDIFENTIYYADTTKLALMKLMRHTISTESNITYHYKFNGANAKPIFVKIYHATKQSIERVNPCSFNNSGCEHFCLLSHSDNSINANTFRCKCKVGFQLRRDLKTCQKIQEYLYTSQTNIIRGISLDQTVDSESRVPIIMPRLGAARAIEVDCINNRTFYHDPIRRAIFQNKYDVNNPDLSITTPLIPDDIFFIGMNLKYFNFYYFVV